MHFRKITFLNCVHSTSFFFNRTVLEVVYAFSLQDAIEKAYLKKVRINSYSNTRTNEFIEVVIADFLQQTTNKRYEGMLPKILSVRSFD